MEMRGREDIEIGRDLTPTLTPLSFSLHDSYLHSHCSACFSPLSSPFPSTPNPNPLLYCSPPCSVALSPLHYSSSERYLPSSAQSSHLRAALRLLRSRRPSPSPSARLAGLLSNRRILTSHQKPPLSDGDDDDDVTERIRLGAGAMAEAMSKQRAVPNDDAVLEEATVALCAVLTNAVEVHDNEGRALGIAVYDTTFSWINHSCSPNACYRFLLSSSSSSHSEEPHLRIAPHPQQAMRQWELWSKYRFICCCERCSALPLSYADYALQEISVFSCDSTGSYSKFLKDMADRRLTECIDDVISEYLSVGDPESCCDKLEKILMQGLNEQLEDINGKSDYKFTLHPLNHHSLKAYTALASAYKVCASDLLSYDSEIDINRFKGFDMSRIGAAYSLLLAGATHHLFNSESSLIASVANFWIGAGESLLSLIRSSGWSKCFNLGLIVPNLNSAIKFKWSKCSLIDRIRACISNGQINSADFENVSNEFLCCVSDITQKVWGFLISDCHFLRSCQDPINFSWLKSTKNSSTMHVEGCVKNSYKTDMCYTHEPENSIYICEESTCTDGVECVLQLGVHCLAYGGLLGSICYGPHSHEVCRVQIVLDREENFVLYSHEES